MMLGMKLLSVFSELKYAVSVCLDCFDFANIRC